MQAARPASPEPPSRPAPARSGRAWLAALALVAVTVAAYWNSFAGVFLFDDVSAILANESLRSLWPPGGLLRPPAGTAVSGRPLLNVSLAVNHAISGEAAWSYHVVNLAIHALAGLVLFGGLRRTLRQPALAARFGSAATGIAAVTAALWLLHPLQTAAVTHVVQRAESLAGLCCLLTVYGFVRATAEPVRSVRAAAWFTVSVAAALAGVATKEVAAMAPLLVLLYDQTLVAGSLAAAWRARRGYYLTLGASWLVLAALAAGAGGQLGGIEFGAGVSVGEYLVTQAQAIALYLRLAFWPAPLAVDYGPLWVAVPTDVWVQALLIVGLLAAVVEAVMRRSPLGFAGAWFFGFLAPASSFLPIPGETIAEHRMYLPLAAVLVLVGLGAHRLAGRAGLALLAVLALGLGWRTHGRNELYRSDLALWGKARVQRPANVRALHELGQAHARRGQAAEAVRWLEEALRLDPALRFVASPAAVHTQVGRQLVALGRPGDAILHFQEALQRDPYHAAAHLHLAVALMKLDRPAIAVRHFREAARLNLDGVETRLGLAAAYQGLGRESEAAEERARARALQAPR